MTLLLYSNYILCDC